MQSGNKFISECCDDGRLLPLTFPQLSKFYLIKIRNFIIRKNNNKKGKGATFNE